MGCKAVVVRRYEDPYHPISLTLWNCAVMAPSAGAMMVWSRATRKMARQRDEMMRVSFAALGY